MADERGRRLAEQLRANLRRRKAQSRARTTDPAGRAGADDGRRSIERSIDGPHGAGDGGAGNGGTREAPPHDRADT